jgi:hypothetical protein
MEQVGFDAEDAPGRVGELGQQRQIGHGRRKSRDLLHE